MKPRRGDLFAIEVSGRGDTLTIGARISSFFATEMTQAESVEAEQLTKELLRVLGRAVIRATNREIGTTFQEAGAVFHVESVIPQFDNPFPDEEL